MANDCKGFMHLIPHASRSHPSDPLDWMPALAGDSLTGAIALTFCPYNSAVTSTLGRCCSATLWHVVNKHDVCVLKFRRALKRPVDIRASVFRRSHLHLRRRVSRPA